MKLIYKEHTYVQPIQSLSQHLLRSQLRPDEKLAVKEAPGQTARTPRGKGTGFCLDKGHGLEFRAERSSQHTGSGEYFSEEKSAVTTLCKSAP